MKRRILVLVLSLLLLVLVTGTVLGGGAHNGTFVKFDFTDPADNEYYCEGYFLKTGSGIVHEWRNNSECINWGLPINSFHLVFKPTAKFDLDGFEDEDLLGCWPGEWTLTKDYVDYMDGDEANLTDFFGDDETPYWSCVYFWDSKPK